ncbi:MAG: hypothetical protein FJ295_10880 [Planctomycetes bacterium]|nr:hypothetical protein [Planctomycetota bacterium]
MNRSLILVLASLIHAIGPWNVKVVRAQQVATDPTSTHIYPAGARRGTTFAVRIGGECLPPETRLRLDSESIQAPSLLVHRASPQGEPSPRRRPGEQHVNYPKEWESEWTIAADARLGTHLWWLACARGGTAARVFVVGDLPEQLESESNSLPQQAESVSVPVTLNGRICGERDLDFYEFPAQQGEVMIVDVCAGRIGSPLEPVLEFFRETGERLAAREERVGSDPVFAIPIRESGRVRMSVGNLGLSGGPSFVYRITVSSRPYPRLAYPNFGRPGSNLDLDWLLLTGCDTPAWSRRPLQFPAQPVRFLHRGDGLVDLPFEAIDLPGRLEAEPNSRLDQAQLVEFPAIVQGRLEDRVDEDWFAFEAEAGKSLTVRCQSAGVGLPTLPVISLHDPAGVELVRASAVDDAERLPAIENWTPASAGRYALRVRDVQQGVAGGAEYAYRILVERSRPDFRLSLKSGAVNHLPGGRTEIDIQLKRLGGFNGPVRVSGEPLPEGVRAEPLEIPANVTTAKWILVSETDTTPPADVLLRVQGTAELDGQLVVRSATVPHLGRDMEAVAVGEATSEWFHLTVIHPPVFRLFCSEAYQYAHRGTVHHYLMQVERLRGFQGPIRLQIADRQNKDLDGVEVLEVTIPEGESQIMLPLYLPESMHINVQAHSNVYAQGIAAFDDRWGGRQTTCVVSEMRCMIRTLPTVAMLRPLDTEAIFDATGRAECRFRLERSPRFGGPVTLRLLSTDLGVEAEPLSIPSGSGDATMTLRRVATAAGAAAESGEIRSAATRSAVTAAGTSAPSSTRVLRFRAEGDLDGSTKVISEATVRVP